MNMEDARDTETNNNPYFPYVQNQKPTFSSCSNNAELKDFNRTVNNIDNEIYQN